MATLLLIVIFIAFIGLGIPDSLWGPAWPAIYKDFNVPISYASFVTCTVTIGTIISCIFSSRIIQKVGTRNVVIVSTFMTVLGLIGYHFSPNLGCIICCAIPLGLGAGCIDTALNNYVAVHYKNSVMNFLHCFYGIGVTLSPFLMSVALADNENWRKGYLIAFFIQLGIAILLALSYPLWTKVEAKEEEQIEMIHLPMKRMISLPMVILASLSFFFYCGVEVTCGVWNSSYLVQIKGLDVSIAARICSLFYAGMATGRFVAGISSYWLGKVKLILCGAGFLLLGLLFLLLGNVVIASIGLFIIGFGCGPIFPNLMGLSPEYYGKEYSQSIIGMEMAFAYIGCLSLSPLFGVVAQYTTFLLFPFYLLGLYICLLILLGSLFYLKFVKKLGSMSGGIK